MFLVGYSRKAKAKGTPSYYGVYHNHTGWNLWENTPCVCDPPKYGLIVALPEEYLK